MEEREASVVLRTLASKLQPVLWRLQRLGPALPEGRTVDVVRDVEAVLIKLITSLTAEANAADAQVMDAA